MLNISCYNEKENLSLCLDSVFQLYTFIAWTITFYILDSCIDNIIQHRLLIPLQWLPYISLRINWTWIEDMIHNPTHILHAQNTNFYIMEWNFPPTLSFLNTRIILCEEYKLWSSLLCNFPHPPVTSSLLNANTPLSILFLNTLDLCSFLNVKRLSKP